MIGFLARLMQRSPPKVELGTARDSAAFARLHAAAFHRGWSEGEFEQILIERNALAHRSRQGRNVNGFIVSRLAGDEAEILSVAVAKSAQGRGIGGALLAAHLGTLAGRGIRTVFLEVEEANRAARALYRRCGFTDVGRREGYYRQPGAMPALAVVMRRDLV